MTYYARTPKTPPLARDRQAHPYRALVVLVNADRV
jgi:hypothetical protein